jgi:NAD(P)-dependent dehydrogenase (short-subunit alcohol dehydrogenase family)
MHTSQSHTFSDAYGREIRKSLSGKTALVTGATGILGSEVAKELARRGARLILHYNSHIRRACELELALKMLGTDVTIIQADFTQPSDVKELIQGVNNRFDHLDFLVHAAGVCKISSEPLIPSDDDLMRVHQINQLAPIEITFGVEDKMKPGSVILYVGSSVEDAFLEGMAVFGDSKKGLHHFASRYSSGMNERGISSIYYIPGVLRSSTPQVLYGQYSTNEMLMLGQTTLLEPITAARNVVLSLISGSTLSVWDEHEGALLVRRDGYKRQPISEY